MNFQMDKIEKKVNGFNMALIVEKDYLKAYISVSKLDTEESEQVGEPVQDYVTMDNVMIFLKENDIKYGLDLQVMASMVASKKFDEPILIAQATLPVDGKDAVIKFNFDLSKNINLVQDEDGNIDFKALNWFQQAKTGDEIAYKIPAEEGVPGKNVKGTMIVPAAGKDIQFKYGKNVEVSEDGLKLIASSDGRLEYIDGKISVNEILVIDGDVDTGVGNIDFVGGVVVKGDVKSGFGINAKGSLEVNGVIEACNINVMGDLVVKGGIQGSELAQIEVKGSVICKFIENANVFSGQDIKTDYIIHSRVVATGKITLNSKKSLIAGGEIIAKESIIASVVGSSMGTKTSITLGIDVEKTRELEKLKQELSEINKETAILTPAIKSGSEMLQKGRMDLIKKITFTKSLKKYNENINRIKEIQDEMQLIQSNMKQIKFSYLSVRNSIYPGVKITIVDNIRYIKDIHQRCKIYLKGNEIAIEEG